MQASRAERVLALLLTRRGPAMAITAGQIAEQLFGDAKLDRQVRVIIEELIKADGYGEIIANTGGEAFAGQPAGYFWATDWSQADRYYQVLVSRLDEIKRRMSAAWAARQRLARAPKGQQQLDL